jgi:glucokinase
MSVIGVDVGATKLAAGVVSPGGEVLSKVWYPTADSPKRLLETVVRAVEEVGTGTRAARCASRCLATF